MAEKEIPLPDPQQMINTLADEEKDLKSEDAIPDVDHSLDHKSLKLTKSTQNKLSSIPSH